MSVFKDVKLQWYDKSFIIPANQVLKAIAIIETHLVFSELVDQLSTGKVSISKMSMAYADVLNFAGANDVTGDEVYKGMFDEDNRKQVVEAVKTLVFMMIPPDVLDTKGVEVAGKKQQGAPVKALRKRSIKRQ